MTEPTTTTNRTTKERTTLRTNHTIANHQGQMTMPVTNTPRTSTVGRPHCSLAPLSVGGGVGRPSPGQSYPSSHRPHPPNHHHSSNSQPNLQALTEGAASFATRFVVSSPVKRLKSPQRDPTIQPLSPYTINTRSTSNHFSSPPRNSTTISRELNEQKYETNELRTPTRSTSNRPIGLSDESYAFQSVHLLKRTPVARPDQSLSVTASTSPSRLITPTTRNQSTQSTEPLTSSQRLAARLEEALTRSRMNRAREAEEEEEQELERQQRLEAVETETAPIIKPTPQRPATTKFSRAQKSHGPDRYRLYESESDGGYAFLTDSDNEGGVGDGDGTAVSIGTPVYPESDVDSFIDEAVQSKLHPQLLTSDDEDEDENASDLSQPISPMMKSLSPMTSPLPLPITPSTTQAIRFKEVDVVVIGGGLSGLVASSWLAERAGSRCSIALLEASDRVGGRLLTRAISINLRSGKTHQVQLDLGGQWIGRDHTALKILAQQWNAPIIPQYHHGSKLAEIDGRMHSYQSSLPTFISYWNLIRLQLLIWRLDRMAQKIPTGEVSHIQNHPYAQQWDSQTVASWMQLNVSPQPLRTLLDATIRGLFGAEACDISMLQFLSYISLNGCSIEKLIEICGGNQESCFQFGSQALVQKMAESLGRGKYSEVKLYLDHAVTCVQTAASSGQRGETRFSPAAMEVVTRNSSGGSGTIFACKYVIIACAPAVQSRIEFIPRLPTLRMTLSSRSFMGSIIKIILLYHRPWWRTKGFSGEVFSDCSNLGESPIFQLYDASRVLTPKLINKQTGGVIQSELLQAGLVAFINGQSAIEWSSRPPDERRRTVLNQISRFFIDRGHVAISHKEMVSPVYYEEKDWTRDPFTLGCPVSLTSPGTLWQAAHILAKPCGHIHFAGTETASFGCGFMEGAVVAGYRSANEVYERLYGYQLQDYEKLNKTSSTVIPPRNNQFYEDERPWERMIQTDHDQSTDTNDESNAVSDFRPRRTMIVQLTDQTHSQHHLLILLMQILLLVFLVVLMSWYLMTPPQFHWAKSTVESYLIQLYQTHLHPILHHTLQLLIHLYDHSIEIWRESGVQMWVDQFFHLMFTYTWNQPQTTSPFQLTLTDQSRPLQRPERPPMHEMVD